MFDDCARTPLITAVKSKKPKFVEKLVSHQNIRLNLAPKRDGNTPLHWVVISGCNIEILNKLLQNGANHALLNAVNLSPGDMVNRQIVRSRERGELEKLKIYQEALDIFSKCESYSSSHGATSGGCPLGYGVVKTKYDENAEVKVSAITMDQKSTLDQIGKMIENLWVYVTAFAVLIAIGIMGIEIFYKGNNKWVTPTDAYEEL